MSDNLNAIAKPRRPKIRRQKVPAFARYKGTSAWTKYRSKARSYAWHLAEEKRKAEAMSA